MSRVSTAKGDRAEIIRDLYVKGMRRAGVQLTDLEGAWAKRGPDPVVLPYAKELRNNRFLHHIQATLLGDLTPYLVLLCEKRDGEIVDIVIPPGRARTILRKASRVARGIKINVHNTGDKWEILIPFEGRIDVTRYIGKWFADKTEKEQTA